LIIELFAFFRSVRGARVILEPRLLDIVKTESLSLLVTVKRTRPTDNVPEILRLAKLVE
jgi:hypothetical protein